MDFVYLLAAVIGGTLFVAQFILQFTGIVEGGSDGSVDMHTGDINTDTQGHGSDVSFQYLSFQAFSAFFTVFGLAGLAMHRQSHFPAVISLPLSILAGLGTLRALAFLYSWIRSLQSTGNLDLSSVAGSQGTVYMRIPENGTGQVEIRVAGRLRTYDAISLDGHILETGDSIQVVSMSSDHKMTVKKV
jgi:hypothetical protein